jgi:hypothetical protein
MTTKRKGDLASRPRFGPDRFFEDSGKWYFYTREGTIEGSFTDRTEADRYLQNYIEMISANLSGKLSLEPLQRS